MVSFQSASFGGYRHCSSEDIMILVCHVILQNRVIKGSCEFMGKTPSRQVTILPSLLIIGTVVVEMFVTWSWRDDFTRTCLVCLIQVNSRRCICLSNLLVKGLIEMEISILISILTWIPWKNLNSRPRSGIKQDF